VFATDDQFSCDELKAKGVNFYRKTCHVEVGGVDADLFTDPDVTSLIGLTVGLIWLMVRADGHWN
jgi:hypothetical protein